ncbi:type IV pilin N-terminal domain-containing protein [Halovivax limisalsi]|uniref:type IV pilin N-terminal domain-containing protein n=1 Tax=Halovivax limisalsi TaxID=1453760 RepID=UPI001FFCD0E1|nr:type IV pilin N-terminal domain-containing protein [Halovivax limisalsi]
MPPTDQRSIAPIVGVLCLLALTVCLAGVAAVTITSIDPVEPAPNAALDLTVDSETHTFEFAHHHGDPLDVTAIDVTVTVEGTPLADQPPVPFFQTNGFEGGPTGPFNSRADPSWHPGESAGFRVAATNEPPIDSGDRVVATVETTDGRTIATLETTAT